MHEYLATNITNPTLILDTTDVENQGVLVPQPFFQITKYHDNCLKISTTKLRLATGLNAGAFGKSIVFYKSIPVKETAALVNLTQPKTTNKGSELQFGNAFETRESYRFDLGDNDEGAGNRNDAKRSCDLSDDDDAEIIAIKL